jgi:hypothetical protein
MLEPRMVLTTYEGEACERMIWHAARAQGRRPLCVGYQHARLLPRAHAIRRSLRIPGFECDPDVVLTLGEIPHTALACSSELAAVKLILYGSHRGHAPVEAPTPPERPQRCLVLPGADPQECEILFRFAIACAQRLPAHGFVLRLHPATDLNRLLEILPELRHPPANITFSSSAFESDCAAARYCIYRGSSAVLQAVRAGIKPFYLSQPNELPFDVLAALPGWRETIATPEDLASHLQLAAAHWDHDLAEQAAELCDGFVCERRAAALDELLDLLAKPDTSPRQPSRHFDVAPARAGVTGAGARPPNNTPSRNNARSRAKNPRT